mgnify:CR=1 FL=1
MCCVVREGCVCAVHVIKFHMKYILPGFALFFKNSHSSGKRKLSCSAITSFIAALSKRPAMSLIHENRKSKIKQQLQELTIHTHSHKANTQEP